MPASDPTNDINTLFKQLPDAITVAIQKGVEKAVEAIGANGGQNVGYSGDTGLSAGASAPDRVPTSVTRGGVVLNGGDPSGAASVAGKASDPFGSILGYGALASGFEGAALGGAAMGGAESGIMGDVMSHTGLLTGAALYRQYSQFKKNDKRFDPSASMMSNVKGAFTNAQTGKFTLSTPVKMAMIGSVMKSGPVPMAMSQLKGLVSPQTVLAGQQAGGTSRSGFAGSFLGSSAQVAGLGQNWRAMLASYGGMNPNYSYGQALQAQQTIAASGYWGDNANFLTGQMRSLYQNAQLNPQEVMGLYDPVMRFGGSSDVLRLQLEQLGQAAKAAHLGLTQFGQDLAQTSQGITSSTGMIGPEGSLQALSAGTRMAPSALSGLYSNQNLIMGSALTHQNIGDVMLNQNSARVSAAMAMPSAMWGGLTGHMSFQQFRQLPAAQQAGIKNRLSYAYMSDPNIFGGMSVTQMFDQWSKGVNFTQRMQGYSDVSTSATQKQFMHAIHEFGGPGGGEMGKWFKNQHFDLNSGKGVQAAQKALISKMSNYLDKQNNDAQRKVTIALDPQARKLFTLLGGDKSSQNAGSGSGWRTAIGIGQDVVAGGIGAALGGPAGALVGVGISNSIEGMTGW